jgi:hypothetical protein
MKLERVLIALTLVNLAVLALVLAYTVVGVWLPGP